LVFFSDDDGQRGSTRAHFASLRKKAPDVSAEKKRHRVPREPSVLSACWQNAACCLQVEKNRMPWDEFTAIIRNNSLSRKTFLVTGSARKATKFRMKMSL
jgi:hypothetical protein